MRIINLLPKTKQKELRYELIYRSLLTLVKVMGASIIIVFALQFLTRLYLAQRGASLDASITTVQRAVNKSENAQLRTRIGGINAEMADFKNLSDSTPAWSQVLRALGGQIPSGVTVNTATMTAADRRIVISGYSPTREQVIALYNNIKQDSKEFSDIDYPLENVAKPADISFHFSFLAQPELLKVKQPAP